MNDSLSSKPESGSASDVGGFQQTPQQDNLAQEVATIKASAIDEFARIKEVSRRLQEQGTRNEGIVYFAFLVMLIMVATMIVMVMTMLIQVIKDDKPNFIYSTPSSIIVPK